MEYNGMIEEQRKRRIACLAVGVVVAAIVAVLGFAILVFSSDSGSPSYGGYPRYNRHGGTSFGINYSSHRSSCNPTDYDQFYTSTFQPNPNTPYQNYGGSLHESPKLYASSMTKAHHPTKITIPSPGSFSSSSSVPYKPSSVNVTGFSRPAYRPSSVTVPASTGSSRPAYRPSSVTIRN